MTSRQGAEPVLVACPDARPPAYQAVIGLNRAGLLRSFQTAYYYRERPAIAALGPHDLAPEPVLAKVERALLRRHDPEILRRPGPHGLGFRDLALKVEGDRSLRAAAPRPGARSRGGGPERFDR